MVPAPFFSAHTMSMCLIVSRQSAPNIATNSRLLSMRCSTKALAQYHSLSLNVLLEWLRGMAVCNAPQSRHGLCIGKQCFAIQTRYLHAPSIASPSRRPNAYSHIYIL